MNAAELAKALTFFGCGVAAGLVAASEKTGWFTVLFALVGFALGFGSAFFVHKLAYWLLAVGGRQSGAFARWGILIAYVLLPLAVAFGSIVTTGWLTFLFIRHVH